MRAWSSLLVALLSLSVFAGCITDSTDDPGMGSGEELVTGLGNYTLPETILGLEEVHNMQFTLPDGTVIDDVSVDGIWFHDNLLFTSGRPGLGIIDVTVPMDPKMLFIGNETTYSRDVDIMEHPNGFLYAVLAGTHSDHGGVVLVNVTDPQNAEVVGVAKIPIHNIAVVPGTALVYNSRSLYSGQDVATEGGLLDIVDFADPAEPTITPFRFGKTVMTAGGIPKTPKAPACHDVSVYVDVNRAYCAGVTETQVWDITDPAAPKIIQIVDNPGTNIHHAAYAAKDHNLLVIGDELGGAALSPGCTVPDQPYGGVWFIDISDLSQPTPVGWWAPAEPNGGVAVNPGGNLPVSVPTCTAHFGNFIEDRDLLVMGFYRAGVFVIDFSDPSAPKEIANYRPGGNVWEGQYYRGFVYTGDTARGVDVLRPVGDGEVILG